MKVLVVGCGKIGVTVMSSLVDEGHDVTVMDIDPQIVENITNIYDVMGVCGSGTDYNTLIEAGIESTELIVSVTSSDELNMLCCYIAQKLGVQHTIARIRSPQYNVNNFGFLRQHLGISMSINPELIAAHEMFNSLRLPYASKIESFSQKNFEIVEMVLRDDSQLVGVPLMNIRNKLKQNFLICAVQRGEQVFIPAGDFVLRKGDRIGLTASLSEVHKLMKELGLEHKPARNVMILGGSRTAYYLTHLLSMAGINVRLIEKDPRKCDELSKTLPPRTVIINGDGAQQELLLEEGLNTTDAFVALTGMDEENILISIFASTKKVPKVISKVNRRELIAMAANLGLDSIVCPRKSVSDMVLRYARALENSKGSNVETLYKIMDDRAEVLEFKAGADFRGLGIPLRDLTLKKNILIAGIIRDRKAIIPTGHDKFESGDRVIVVAAGSRLNDLSDILG